MSSVRMKTVLVVGSGGREHALTWKLSRSPRVKRVIAVPGNSAWGSSVELWPLQDFEQLAARALEAKVDLVVIGPDNPLADRIVDVLEARGLRCFGPTAAAAKIESSKAFAKEVMQSAGVPTARHFVAKSQDEAERILGDLTWGNGWVIKADGLALGKGVRVCASREEARAAARELIAISGQLVIEERLSGEEISWMALCDGERCALLEPARDHKRLLDGNQGPNTGGMGAFSPVPGIPANWAERVRNEVFLPTLREMNRRGTPFRGVLYAGLMADISRDRFWVLEFNARFGDPEAQVLLTRISDDLYPWLEACATRDLRLAGSRDVPFVRDSAVVVVGAAKGYPEKPEKGQEIKVRVNSSSESVPDCFWAGVTSEGPGCPLRTSGGRVFGALGMGQDLQSARARAYEHLEQFTFSGMQFRKDIAEPSVPIAILASGRGSNFDAILSSIRSGQLNAEIRAVISDREDAAVLEKARAAGIQAIVLPDAGKANREQALLKELEALAPRFLVLAGYMRILGPALVERYRSPRGYSRIVNIHPSLLPAFAGAAGYRDAYRYGAKVAGVTVHLVDEKLDHGPICAQEAFSIADCRSEEEVLARGLPIEHRLYSETLKWVLTERFEIEERIFDQQHLRRECVRPS